VASIVLLSACAARIVPAPLASIAEERATGLSKDRAAQRRYLDHFALGARDALIWRGEVEQARSDSAAACEGSAELQLRTVECGYADGILAVMEGRKSVTLEDFGYRRATIDGRVKKEAGSAVRYVEAVGREHWIVVSSPTADRLTAEDCYRLDGFLGRRGALGARHQTSSREFVVMNAVRMESCAAAENR
jgi:hypothetical protein